MCRNKYCPCVLFYSWRVFFILIPSSVFFLWSFFLFLPCFWTSLLFRQGPHRLLHPLQNLYRLSRECVDFLPLGSSSSFKRSTSCDIRVPMSSSIVMMRGIILCVSRMGVLMLFLVLWNLRKTCLLLLHMKLTSLNTRDHWWYQQTYWTCL